MTLARVPAPSESTVAATPAAPLLARRDLSSLRSPPLAGLAALAVAAAAIGGAAVGVSTRHTSKEAAAVQRAAEQRAYAAARGKLALRGREDGLRAGTAAGTAAGTREGRQQGSGAASARSKAAATPKGIQNCPKTPIRNKTFVSSVRGISCAAAASEQLRALRSKHPTRTPGGFTCTRIDKLHYRCTKGTQAYRWDISP